MTTDTEIKKFIKKFSCKFCNAILVDGEHAFECDDNIFHEVTLIKAALKKFKS